MTLNFVLKTHKSGTISIIARFYSAGQPPKDKPTGFTVDTTKHWDSKKHRVANNAKANELITSWKNRFDSFISELDELQQEPELDIVVMHVCGEKSIKLKGFTLIDAIDNWVELNKAERDPKTIERYDSVLRNFLLGYEEWRKENAEKRFSPINLDGIKNTLLKDLANYDVTYNKSLNTTINRRLGSIKTIYRHAVSSGMTKNNVIFMKPLLKEAKINRFSLTEDELLTLKKYKPISKPDRRDLDAFLFSSETSLRLEDVLNIAPVNVTKDENGISILNYFLNKGGIKWHKVPLSDYAMNILKHRWPMEPTTAFFHDLPLGQKINSNLKDIFKLAKINRPIQVNIRSGAIDRVETYIAHQIVSFHCARHTFATLNLKRGVSIKHVQEIMAHSDIKTTMRYLHDDLDAAIESVHKAQKKIKQAI